VAQFRRIYGYRASSFGIIFAPLSRLNKPPIEFTCSPEINGLLQVEGGYFRVRSEDGIRTWVSIKNMEPIREETG
jgi:hypothetical protein